jgi:phosphonate transport system permease protein
LLSLRAWGNLTEISRQAFPPAFDLFAAGEWVELTAVTLSMSLLAVAGAAVFTIPLAFPAANNFLLPGGIFGPESWRDQGTLGGAIVWVCVRVVLLVSRSIPAPIWALVLLFVMFPGVMPGASALALYTLGVLGRLTAEAVENLDRRPLDALKAQGGSSAGVFAYGVLPLTLPRFIGYLFYRWEEAIRATAVVGLVGAGGLGLALIQQLRSFNWPAVSATLIVFVLITLLVDWISAAARSAFRNG